jgi:DNA-binding LytR/AlgR family response regulator
MKTFTVRKKQGIFVFPIDDIIYMEKNLRKINIHTVDQQIEFYGRFADVVPLLDERFMYCHRSYVINMDKIVWMQKNYIYVSGNETIFFGHDSFSRAKKIFVKYLMGKQPANH